MGSGPSRHEGETKKDRVTLSYSKLRRREDQKQQGARAYRLALLLKYDESKTGSLSRSEAAALARDLLKEDLGEEEIDLMMRVAGKRCDTEITLEELPRALSVVERFRNYHKYLHELFAEQNFDETVSQQQVRDFLSGLTAKDLAYVMHQIGDTGPAIPTERLKAALVCWYYFYDDMHHDD